MTIVERRRKWYLCNSNQILLQRYTGKWLCDETVSCVHACVSYLCVSECRTDLFVILLLHERKGQEEDGCPLCSLRRNFFTRMHAHDRRPWKSSEIAPALNNHSFLTGSIFLTHLSPFKGTLWHQFKESGLFVYRCHPPSFSNSWLLLDLMLFSDSSRGSARGMGEKTRPLLAPH